MRAFNRLLGRLVPLVALTSLAGFGGACAVGSEGAGGGGGEEQGRPDARPRGDASGFEPNADASDPFVFPVDADPGATPPPDSAPAACTTGTWTSIGANGSFDGDPIVWKQFSKAGTAIITSTADAVSPVTAPPTPARYAWLGGYAEARDQVYQTVTVPTNVGGLRVSGKVCVASQEVNPDAFDLMGVTIHDGTTQAQLEPALKVWSNLDKVASCGFKDFTAQAASPHGGQDVIVVFGATSDPSKNTNFFLDSVKIEAMVCP